MIESQESRVSSLFVIPFVQFFVGVLLFIALLHAQQDLAVLSIIVLGIMFCARLWSRLSHKGLTINTRIDKYKVFPDERLTLYISIKNKKILPVRLHLVLPTDGFLCPLSSEETFHQECGLLWYQATLFKWELMARQRGIHRINPLRLRMGDLFGFYTKEKKIVNESLHVIVYPRIVPLKNFSLPKRDFFGVHGSKSPVQDPIYILGTRDYQHWQPARYIHWKASARHNRLQEKIFEPSERERVLFTLDVAPFAKNNAIDDFERTLEVAASLAVQCDQRGFALGFLTNGAIKGSSPASLSISRSPQQLPAILEILARLRMESKEPLIKIVRKGLPFHWGVSGVHFAYEDDTAMHIVKDFFLNRKIPTVFIVCRIGSTSENGRYKPRSNICRLNELRIGDSQRP